MTTGPESQRQVATARLEVEGAIGTLVLDAPWRGNAVDAPMLERVEALCASLTSTGAGSAVRALLVRGAGERAFSTGYHVPSLLAELAAGPSVSDFEGHPLERALRALEAVPVPTIALVAGNAYGAGCELALACDVRLAAEDARLCMPPAKLGVLYSATGMRRLLELVGPSVARELLFTGDVVPGPRALALGLVNRAAPTTSELWAAGRSMAETIAGNAPLSVRHTKTIFRRFLAAAPLDPAVLAEVAAMRDECFRSVEFQERSRRLGERKG